MNESDNEKLRHNPEKGLSSSEKKSDKKSSKKPEKSTEKKSYSSDKDDPNNRPASFFNIKSREEKEAEKLEKEIAKDARETEKTDKNKVPKKENEVDTREVKISNGVETDDSESITESEAREVASHITEARQEDVADNLSRVEPESPEEAEELAAAAFLTNLERHLGSGEDVTPDMLDQASEETLEDLDYDSKADDKLASNYTDPVHEVAVPEESSGDDEHRGEEQTVENDEDLPVVSSGSAPPPHGSHGSSGSGGRGGSSGSSRSSHFPPPLPPSPPSIPPAGATGGGFYSRHYAALPPRSPSTRLEDRSLADQDYSYRRRRAKHLLIGGIVGYVIGRRGGRKRAEKKLQPQIDRLETQVDTLHKEITRREETIRSIARSHAEKERMLKTQQNQKNNTQEKSEKNTTPPAEDVPTKTNKERIELFVYHQRDRQAADEKKRTTERLHAEGSIKKMAETHLVGLGMFVERRKMDGQENNRKRFEDMDERELKTHAKHIVVDGISIVEAYELKRIDRSTMLEVTKRYWRKDTGSYETVFRNNVSPDEKELQQYRDKLHKAHQDSAPLSEEQQHEAARDYARKVAEDFYASDPSVLKSDEERRAYFQRYADENAQATELGTLLKKAQNGSLIKHKTGWIALLIVLSIAFVLWLIMG